MATAALIQRKCLNHGQREAVARCPACTAYFCRECIAEHDGLVLCAACLAKASVLEERTASWMKAALMPAGAALGFCLAWLFFLCLGQILIQIPTSFHDGSWLQDESGGPEDSHGE